MACYYKHVFGVSLFLLFLAFGGSLVCLLTTHWVGSSNFFYGLIAYKKKKPVTDWELRDPIFEFKVGYGSYYGFQTLDIVLVLYIVCAVCAFISTILHIVILKRRRVKSRDGYAATIFFFTLLAAASAIAGVLYGTFAHEELFKPRYSDFVDIYTYYVGWMTSGILFLACVLILCTCCMDKTHRSPDVQYIDDTEIRSNAGAMSIGSAPAFDQPSYNPHHPQPPPSYHPSTPSYPQMQHQMSNEGYNNQPMFQYPMQPVGHHPQY